MVRSLVAAALVVSVPAAAFQGPDLDCLYDAACAGRPAMAQTVSVDGKGGAYSQLAALAPARAPAGSGPRAVPAPAPERARADAEEGVGAGAMKGIQSGAMLGFGGVLAPAVALLSEGFGRRMSRSYDGSRLDNGNAGLYTAAGVALAVVTYVPALALGVVGMLVGAAAGAAAELVTPGSTRSWDAERLLNRLLD